MNSTEFSKRLNYSSASSFIFISIHIDACKRTTDDKSYCLANKIKSYCYTIFLYNYNNTKLLYISRSYFDKINNSIYLKQQNSLTEDLIENACQADWTKQLQLNATNHCIPVFYGQNSGKHGRELDGHEGLSQFFKWQWEFHYPTITGNNIISKICHRSWHLVSLRTKFN